MATREYLEEVSALRVTLSAIEQVLNLPKLEADFKTLEAEATERSATGRTGVYDVTVRTKEGKIIALFRGKSHRIGGEVIVGSTSV